MMIEIKKKIGIPKYRQIITLVENAISDGTLKKGDKLPSINSIKTKNKLSRDTVLTAFNDLKNRGIIQSIVGKGYYVLSENITVKQKIFLLFDELNSFKEDLYNSFLEHLTDNIQIEIYFHHFNEKIFFKLIQDNAGYYSHYIIMPANFKNSNEAIQLLPKDKVYILDQIHEDLLEYPSIYQNFEKAMYKNLSKVFDTMKKYKKLILIFSEKKQPQGILKGFSSFCVANSLNYEVYSSINEKALEANVLYIVLNDKNLLKVIQKMKHQNLSLAKDIGVISYNDTLLKEIVEGGITTISTDFKAMGKRLAQMVLQKENVQIENPNQLIIRNSI